MRIIFAVIMFLHGIAHMAGFIGAWAPTRTTIFGDRINLGPSWIRVVGLGWLLLAIGFGAAANAAGFGLAGWPTFALGVTGASLALCLVQLPETKFGVALNSIVLGGLVLGQHLAWF